MAKKVKKIVWFCGRNILRAAWLCFLVLVFLSGIFIWRVHDRPWDVTFAKSYIESALRDDVTGNYAALERAVLYWPDLRGALFLEINGAKILDSDGVSIVSVGDAAVSFSRVGLLSGRVMPKAIILKNPSIKLLRNTDGVSLDIGMSGQNKKRSAQQYNLTTRIFRHAAQPGRESESNSLISRLEAFSIESARVIIDDKITQQTWSLPDFNFSAESTERGLNASLNVDLPDVGLEASRLEIDFDYIWNEKTVQLDGFLNAIDIEALADKVPELGGMQNQDIVFDAEFNTILDENFSPTDVRLSVNSKTGHVSHDQWSDEPVPYSDMNLNMSYNYPGKTVRVEDTQIQFGAVPFFIEADVTHTKTSAKGPVKLSIGDIEQKDVKPIWPKALEGDGTEVWIVKRMSEGRFKDLVARFDFVAEKKKSPALPIEEDGSETPEVSEQPVAAWSFDVQNLIAEFTADNMSIDYRAPLDKAINTYGKGTYSMDNDELKILVDRGKIGGMVTKDAVFKFNNISKKGQGIADLAIPLKGKIADVLRYVAKEPINLGDKIGMKPSEVKGDADLKITLNFPTRADVLVEDFKIGIDGSLNDVLFPDVIETLDLSGGPLAFEVKEGDISLSGKAMLERREMDFSWQTFLELKGKPYVEKIDAKIVADPNLRQQFGVDLSDFLEGSAGLDVRYVQQTRNTASAQVFVDATPARFFISPFGVEKPAGESAKADFSASFEKGVLKKIDQLNVTGQGFSVKDAMIGFIQNEKKETELHSGRFSGFVADQTQGDLDFVFDDSGAVTIDLNALTLDVQPLMGGDSRDALIDPAIKVPYALPAMRIRANSQKMITAPNKFVKNADVTLDVDANGRYDIFRMHADMIEGMFRLDFDFNRQDEPVFVFQSDNAGAFLSSFDVFHDIRGGTIEVTGERDKDSPRSIVGKAEINKFKVTQAPALAKIVSFFSMGGLADTLAGEGLSFKKLEANYKWIYKAGGSLVEIRKGRTSGNSLGLLFDGTFNMRNGEIDVSGTAAPISGLNKVIGSIPLVGDILTGGSGGIFAATYSLKGTSEKLKVTVNPLAALAPGIVRRILFE